MLAYTRKMQQAASDLMRRLSLKAGAAALLLVGVGFLLAALWTFLATHLGWGSLLASLVIGVLLVIGGLVIMLTSSHVRHHPPTTTELKDEVALRVSTATDAVLDRVTDRAGQTVEKARKRTEEAFESARKEAGQMVDLAGNRISSFVDAAAYRMDRFAGRAERRASDIAGRAKHAMDDRLGPHPFDAAAQKLAEGGRQAKGLMRESNLAAITPLIGAFAIGLTLASRLSGRHADDEGDDLDL